MLNRFEIRLDSDIPIEDEIAEQLLSLSKSRRAECLRMYLKVGFSLVEQRRAADDAMLSGLNDSDVFGALQLLKSAVGSVDVSAPVMEEKAVPESIPNRAKSSRASSKKSRVSDEKDKAITTKQNAEIGTEDRVGKSKLPVTDSPQESIAGVFPEGIESDLPEVEKEKESALIGASGDSGDADDVVDPLAILMGL
jgi:hypothetical protein